MAKTADTQSKSTVVELLLCIFLGMFGAHRFYVRKYGTAILYLFTAGLFYIGWIVDIVLIISRLIKENRRAEAGTFTVPPRNLDTPPVATEKSYSKATPDDVNRIVQSLHDGNFKETVQELYGPSYTDDSEPSDAPAVQASVPNSGTKSVTPVTHKVIGMPYRMDSLMELAVDNPDYDMSKKEIIECGMEEERIWKYSFYPTRVELRPEPDNPYDPNAIKVIVDGQHIGYIKKGSCSRVLKAINENRIQRIECTIGGGPYKIVEENDDYEYEMYRESADYSVTLTVYQSQ